MALRLPRLPDIYGPLDGSVTYIFLPSPPSTRGVLIVQKRISEYEVAALVYTAGILLGWLVGGVRTIST